MSTQPISSSPRSSYNHLALEIEGSVREEIADASEKGMWRHYLPPILGGLAGLAIAGSSMAYLVFYDRNEQQTQDLPPSKEMLRAGLSIKYSAISYAGAVALAALDTFGTAVKAFCKTKSKDRACEVLKESITKIGELEGVLLNTIASPILVWSSFACCCGGCQW